jgi:hypothetical protein
MVILSCVLQCRMEANYAHQQELDMIPLLMQKGYSPKGYARNCCRIICMLRELMHTAVQSATNGDHDTQTLARLTRQ